jgi:hypothetical protein
MAGQGQDDARQRSGWMQAALGVTIPERSGPASDPGAQAYGAARSSQPPAAFQPEAGAVNDAMAAWGNARAAARKSLAALDSALGKSTHPKRDRARIILKAIAANLTETPDTPQKVQALKAYIETDDVIDAAETPNAFAIPIKLKEPLLEALGGLLAHFKTQARRDS